MKLLVRYPIAILVIALALGACAVPFALRLSLDTEVIDLLPPDLPSVRSLRGFQRDVGGHTFVSILVESPDADANRRFALALEQRLGHRPWVYQVDARRDLAFIHSRWPFLVPASDLAEWEATLRDAIARAKVRQSPLSLDLESDNRGWEKLRALINGGSGAAARLREYRTNADGTLLLMQVQLLGLTTDIDRVRNVLSETREDIAATLPADFHPVLRARPYGGLAFRVAEYDAILTDLARASLITLPVILLLPALVLRSWWGPLVVLVPLSIGTVWTYAVANAAFGALNLVTTFLFLVLFGIGDDYPIHLYYCTRDEAQGGRDVRSAIDAALHATRHPLFYSALTDSAAFAGLAWMQFRGFSHFGLMVALGILLVLAATFLCVPGLVSLARWRGELRRASRSPTAGPARALHVQPKSLAVAWAILVLSAIAFAILGARFETDFERLRPNFAELRELRDKVESIEGFQKSTPAVFLTEDFETSRQIARQLQQRMDGGGDQYPVVSVRSLATVLDGDTPERRTQGRRVLELLHDPVLAHAPEDIRGWLDPFVRNADLSPMTLESIPPPVRRSMTRVVKRDGKPYELFLVVADPRFRAAMTEHAIAFSKAVSGIAINGQPQTPAGEALIFADIVRLVRQEALRILAIACALSSVVLWLAFRSARLLALMLLTIGGTIGMTVALVAAMGVRFSFFNVVVLPILFGVGMDYGIHVVHRARAGMIPALAAAGKLVPTIASASATTALGFVGLLFAHHPGLRALGITAFIGVALTALNTLLFLPALYDVLCAPAAQRGAATTAIEA